MRASAAGPDLAESPRRGATPGRHPARPTQLVRLRRNIFGLHTSCCAAAPMTVRRKRAPATFEV